MRLMLLTSLFSCIIFFISSFYLNEEKNNYIELNESLKTKLEKVIVERDSLEKYISENNEEILWLTRTLLSETDRIEEMSYVAWVIRNRVDLKFLGDSTYHEVVTSRNQFSAYNRGYKFRYTYLVKSFKNLKKDSLGREALRISYNVINADSSDRPFSINTLYFYSPISMIPPGRVPYWVRGKREVTPKDLDRWRFRFYDTGH